MSAIMAGGSGLQGKVLLGHKERFLFQKGKVPSFFLEKRKGSFWMHFGKRKGSFLQKERFFLETGKVIFCKSLKRKGSFLKKERFFLEKGKVLLGHKERFFLHIFHTGKVFFAQKAFLSFPCPTPNHRGKVPFGHRKGSFWTQGSFF